MKVSMLTTVDNPFDPFDQYPQWLAWDERAGYCSSGLLARIAVTSDALSEADEAQAIDLAIDEICHFNVLGVFRKVTREYEDREATIAST
jgi:hypothetical protein